MHVCEAGIGRPVPQDPPGSRRRFRRRYHRRAAGFVVSSPVPQDPPGSRRRYHRRAAGFVVASPVPPPCYRLRCRRGGLAVRQPKKMNRLQSGADYRRVPRGVCRRQVFPVHGKSGPDSLRFSPRGEIPVPVTIRVPATIFGIGHRPGSGHRFQLGLPVPAPFTGPMKVAGNRERIARQATIFPTWRKSR